MTDAKKSLLSSVKEALAKKQAAQYPDSKDPGTGTKGQTQRGPASAAGRPLKKAAARGR